MIPADRIDPIAPRLLERLRPLPQHGREPLHGLADRRGRPRPVRPPPRLPHQRPALDPGTLPAQRPPADRPHQPVDLLARGEQPARRRCRTTWSSDTYMFSSRRDQRGPLRLQRDRRRPDRHQRPRDQRRLRLGGAEPQPGGGGAAVHRRDRLLQPRRRAAALRQAHQQGRCSSRDEFTYLRGRHSWKLGVDIRREQIKLAFINRPNGDFTFNGQYTGNAGADFLLGLPAQFRQGGGDPLMDGTSWQYAAFVQDEFRLSPRLTLNLGLRYELRAAVLREGRQAQHLPARRCSRCASRPRPSGLLYPGDPGIPRGTYEADKNNFAPRLAVAWDPHGRRARPACARPGGSSTTSARAGRLLPERHPGPARSSR